MSRLFNGLKVFSFSFIEKVFLSSLSMKMFTACDTMEKLYTVAIRVISLLVSQSQFKKSHKSGHLFDEPSWLLFDTCSL